MAEHDMGFRTAQAVADLVHHIGPLIQVHFGALTAASELSPQEAGAALVLLRDDGFARRREETRALVGGLEDLASAGGAGFDLAVLVLLADLLQRRQGMGLLAEVWDEAARRLTERPATLRAAVANGLVRAGELGLMALKTPPSLDDCLTREAAEISEHLLQIARSMRPDQLDAVARADFGDDAALHLGGLKDLIGKRNGILRAGEYIIPLEVVQLSSNDPDHPGFAGCTAILLLNALESGDRHNRFKFHWARKGEAYGQLKPSHRDPILAAFRHIYESDRDFAPETAFAIPVVDHL
jgi:hypothetical protein